MRTLTIAMMTALSFGLYGRSEGSNSETAVGEWMEADTALPFNMVEAELGDLGADFDTVSLDGAGAILITSDLINSLNPGSADRVATYMVRFTEPGIYELYARVRVGPATWDDDSQFIPNGFGIKDPAQDTAWFRVNGLASAGYTAADAIVDGGGSAQSGAWKWINLSRFAEGAGEKTYSVTEDSLTRYFQIGARENGLYMDRFVFGKSGLYYTVEILMNGEEGMVTLPRDGTPLAEGQDKFLGSAYDDIQAPGFTGYWNQLTPGNAGKWGSVEWTRDQMNWSALDVAYNEAKRYGMLFKEHTLLWGAQQPEWMNDLDSAEQRQEIEEWFAALADRYPDFDMIDVVNEPIHNAPNGMIPWGTSVPNIDYAGALGGAGVTGWDWIIEAFRLARQYFPDAKLILNEYSVINSTSVTQNMIEIVNLLKAEDLIDGIGEQAHAFTTRGVSSSLLKTNLDALAATGIPLYITEFDIDGPTDLEQLQEIRRVFPVFWEHPAMAGITLWGYRYGLWRNDQGAYLITEDGTERPAMTWLKAYVNDTLHEMENILVTSATGDTVIGEIGGSLTFEAEVIPANATFKDFIWSVEPESLATIDTMGILTALAEGTVTVKATAWDGSGASGSMEIEIRTENVSAEEFSSELLRIYPNPSSEGTFHITGMSGTDRLTVTDLSGKVVSNFDCRGISNLEFTLDQPGGIYIFQFISESVRQNVKVVVIR
ncbi:MAG: endo-1,4-beta-xylanase [Bacteroidales bacterium]